MAPTNVSLRLLVDTVGKRVLYAEANKDFVDLLFHMMSLPVGTVLRFLREEGMVGKGCLGNFSRSIEKLIDASILSGSNKDAFLKAKVSNVQAMEPKVTYIVMNDLTVNPMSTFSSLTLLKEVKSIKGIGALQERVVIVGLDEVVKLLMASLQSKTVLTDVFLNRKAGWKYAIARVIKVIKYCLMIFLLMMLLGGLVAGIEKAVKNKG
ncbi:hypothetical protein COLO4_10927 [Corchorus olitorius]|uniref:DUF674 domain-containing protein n=1 Tax=Corchorus olitorius TaxID=93759 RepID=A0A1R3K6H2_9ROSI|nr:hypothetical protein COLO4_10927 [Corchorus olitorius]